MKLTYKGVSQMMSFAGRNGKAAWEGTLWHGKTYTDLPVDNDHVRSMIAAGVLEAVPETDAKPVTKLKKGA